MRKVVGNNVRNEDERLSGSRLLEMLGLKSIEMMIRKKRLQWIAHCARRGESDLTWRRMRRELQDEQSRWGEQIREEWKKGGVESVKQWCEKVENWAWMASKIGSSKKEKGKNSKGSKDKRGNAV